MSLLSRSPGWGPADLRRPSALARLVAVRTRSFSDGYWGERPLLSRGAELPSPFDDLFSLDALDELVSQRGLRTPFLRVAKDGQTLRDAAFTSGGGVGAGIADQVSDDKLLSLFADGSTLVLQGLHRTWQPIIEFVSELAEELGHPVQANAYVTPARSRGFSDHYDVHDVFVLQVAGEKHWQIRTPVHERPSRDQPWTDHRALVEAAAAEPPLIDVTLQPGDCLYLPRGFLHSATAADSVSAHLTLGVHPWTREHLAEALVAEALRDVLAPPEGRASLAAGVDVGDPADVGADLEQVRARLADAVRVVEPQRVAARLEAQARRSARPGAVPPLAQVTRAETLTSADTVRLRPFLRARLVDARQGGAVVQSRAGELPVPAADRAAVAAFLSDGQASVADLGVELARRLLLAGVAV